MRAESFPRGSNTTENPSDVAQGIQLSPFDDHIVLAFNLDLVRFIESHEVFIASHLNGIRAFLSRVEYVFIAAAEDLVVAVTGADCVSITSGNDRVLSLTGVDPSVGRVILDEVGPTAGVDLDLGRVVFDQVIPGAG